MIGFEDEHVRGADAFEHQLERVEFELVGAAHGQGSWRGGRGAVTWPGVARFGSEREAEREAHERLAIIDEVIKPRFAVLIG